MFRYVAILVGLLLAGCYTVRSVDVPFNAEDAAFINNPGSARVEGQGFMRQRGGGVVTAAGETVELVPVTPYSEARIAAIYQGAKINRTTIGIEDSPPDYDIYKRRTTANAQGDFIFEDVPPGQYFVTTAVQWMAGDWPQGGSIYERIYVPEGSNQVVNVLLTGQ